jgi:MHS family proline/betaine transporter-like MFS transporter
MSASSAAVEPAMRGAGAATRLIIASSVGNALEFYEILVYGYFAVTISKVFFPAANEAVSLLVTLGTFGISFLARPVGAIFLGAYGDRKGRKRALTLSILLMTIGTGLMTVMPSYGSVGLLAPILVIAARLLQGFSVGEFASSTAFLVEHRPDRAGFFASWQWSSQGFAALVATGLGVLLTTSMSADTLQAWGWRIPFAVGLLIGPVGYYIRNRLDETPEFIEAGEARRPIRDLFVGQWDRLLLTIGAVAASTSSQYLLVYMPTYAIRELNLPQSIGFTAAMLAAALQTIAVPFVGIWVDRVGQTHVMIGAAILFMVTAYPAFVLLDAAPSLGVLIGMVCWISVLKSLFSGALPSLMAKTFPVSTRVSGMSLSYSLSSAGSRRSSPNR